MKTFKRRKCVPCTKKIVGKKKVTTDLFISNVSKVYERCLYDLIYDFFENKFSRYQCGFRKGFNTQNVLLSMVEKMLLAHDKREVCRAILTDLSKFFDCINHDMIIAKLNAYGFDHNALDAIHNYLFGRSQKTKVCCSFSGLLDLLYGLHKVPY